MKLRHFILSVFCIFSLSNCALWQHREEDSDEGAAEKAEESPQASSDSAAKSAPSAAKPADSAEVAALKLKTEELESKISGLTQQIALLQNQQGKNETIAAHPAVHAGNPAKPVSSGGSHSEATQQYREALLLLEGEQYAKAAVEFGDFLREYPDHALAGGAQFHLGQAVLAQKQNKQALEEFRKLLVSYDRSSHVPDALVEIIRLEEAQGETKSAQAHRQMLQTYYPQSSAARSLGMVSAVPAKASHETKSAPAHAESPKKGSYLDPPPELSDEPSVQEPQAPTAPVDSGEEKTVE